MATSAARPPSTVHLPLQIAARWMRRSGAAAETLLEAERDQLAHWVPVAMGGGICAWFVLPAEGQWIAALLMALGIATAGCVLDGGGRLGRCLILGSVTFALGLGLVWFRAERLAAPVLRAPLIGQFTAKVEQVDELAARALVRVRLAPIQFRGSDGRWVAAGGPLPRHVRVNLAEKDVPAGLERGSVIRLGARLTPPPPPAVPGAYDYARVAWFDQIGATGRGFAPIAIIAGPKDRRANLRADLSSHIRHSAPGAAGAIAAALATGDQGAIPTTDAEAMRQAGLAHLLSVSGLHITAVVGGVMMLTLRLLALSPFLALRLRLPLIAAGAGALAAIGYTLLTGSEVPTVRSCVAALLVLLALVLGREALTMRLVAAGALVVLVAVPEALAGPSFQLSFAAVTSIVVLHQTRWMKRRFEARDEHPVRKIVRNLGSLLLTGLIVEAALIPIGLFHFHKAGVYGSIANLVAIPLTTFAIMPAEAVALLGDAVGLGAPFWWIVARLIDLLLWIAHQTASMPGAVAALPVMPGSAFGLMVAGGLWLALWTTRWRLMGLAPVVAGATWALATPSPDIVVTGDGRHAGFRTPGGDIALLRDRTGDYTGDMLMENSGTLGLAHLVSDQPNAKCSRDACIIGQWSGRRMWRILATRSAYPLPHDQLVWACAKADIVISERWLPRACTPRWIRIDLSTLKGSGGIAIVLATKSNRAVSQPGDTHPWHTPPLTQAISRNGAATPKVFPARGLAGGRNAADHKRDWPGPAGPSSLPGGNI